MAVHSLKRFHIQIQPARSTELRLEELVSRLSNLVPGARVTKGSDNGPYINVDFEVSELGPLWNAVREELRSNPAFARTAIIVCEGEHGWDDYLQLHHFNPEEPLDPLA